MIDMLLASDDEQMTPELIALCVNLATNNKNAELMVQNNRLQGLVEKAFKNQNAILMKIVRNISQHESTKENFVVRTAIIHPITIIICTKLFFMEDVILYLFCRSL